VSAGLPVLLGGLYLLHSFFRYFDHDEFEAVHTGWKILQGQVIYRDFFQHHHAAVYHLLSGLMALTGQEPHTLVCIRLVFLAMSAGIVWLTWLLARDLLGSHAAAGSAVLLLLGTEMFCAAAVEIRPDVPQVLFGMFGLWATQRGGRADRPLLSCLGGGSLALSFVFLQKALVVIVLVLAAQGLAVWQRRMRARHLGLHLVGLLLTLLPFGLYLWLTDFLSTYFFWNWTLNLHFPRPVPDWFFLRQSLLLNAPTWILFAVGLGLAVRGKAWSLVLTGGLASALLGAIAAHDVHYPQYFLHFFPLMTLLAAHGLHAVVRRREVLAAVLVLACLGSVGKFTYELVARGNADQLAKVAYVLNGTETTDAVYDGNAQFNLFRPDVDYFWFSVRPGRSGLSAYKALKGYEYDLMERIARLRPRVVSTYLLGVEAAALKGYRPSTVYPDLLWRVDAQGPNQDGAP
jgi:hypothetical protein